MVVCGYDAIQFYIQRLYGEIQMNNDFKLMKKNRKTEHSSLTTQLNKINPTQQGPQEDTRFWKPTVDKSNNGYAVIRFLPAPKNEDVPFIRIWDHGFKGLGGWYIEKSLTTLGQKDPVSEYNSQLWATGVEANKKKVREQKRRLSFISNIYVVKDPGNPANEGKVFLYQYGKKIFDKLNAAVNPEFEDEQSINPFDMWEGANFKLKIRDVEGYRNYDSSSFEQPGPLSEDDDELERVWNSEHGLQEFLDPKNFKTYEELKAKLNRVLNLDGSASSFTSSAEQAGAFEEEERIAAPPKAKVAQAKPVPQNLKQAMGEYEDEDDNIDFFKKLAEE